MSVGPLIQFIEALYALHEFSPRTLEVLLRVAAKGTLQQPLEALLFLSSSGGSAVGGLSKAYWQASVQGCADKVATIAREERSPMGQEPLKLHLVNWFDALLAIDRSLRSRRLTTTPCAVLCAIDPRCAASLSYDDTDDFGDDEADEDDDAPHASDGHDDEREAIREAFDEASERASVLERATPRDEREGDRTVGPAAPSDWDVPQRAMLSNHAFVRVMLRDTVVKHDGAKTFSAALRKLSEHADAPRRDRLLVGVTLRRHVHGRFHDLRRECDPLGWNVAASLRYALSMLAETETVTLRAEQGDLAVKRTATRDLDWTIRLRSNLLPGGARYRIRNATTIHRSTPTEPPRPTDLHHAATLWGQTLFARPETRAPWEALRWRLVYGVRDDRPALEALRKHLEACVRDDRAPIDGLSFGALALAAKAPVRTPWMRLLGAAASFINRTKDAAAEYDPRAVLRAARGLATRRHATFEQDLHTIFDVAINVREYERALSVLSIIPPATPAVDSLEFLKTIRETPLSSAARFGEALEAMRVLLAFSPTLPLGSVAALLRTSPDALRRAVGLATKLLGLAGGNARLEPVTALVALNPRRIDEIRRWAVKQLKAGIALARLPAAAAGRFDGPPEDNVQAWYLVERTRALVDRWGVDMVRNTVNSSLSRAHPKHADRLMILFGAALATSLQTRPGSAVRANAEPFNRWFRTEIGKRCAAFGRSQYFEWVRRLYERLAVVDAEFVAGSKETP